jgi:hypothetical protein
MIIQEITRSGITISITHSDFKRKLGNGITYSRFLSTARLKIAIIIPNMIPLIMSVFLNAMVTNSYPQKVKIIEPKSF